MTILRTCPECGCWEYAGAPDCTRCAALVDALVSDGWQRFLTESGFEPGFRPEDEQAVAAMVAEEPDRHPWRVVDAAFDRLTCPDCGSRWSRGPAGCPACDLADGHRYAAIEVDRAGVPPGNEHAIRVNVAVVRRAHAHSPTEVLTRRAILPALLAGALPTIAEAQRVGALAKRGITYAELAPMVADLAERAPTGVEP